MNVKVNDNVLVITGKYIFTEATMTSPILPLLRKEPPSVSDKRKHPVYKKTITYTKRFKAHDEANEYHISFSFRLLRLLDDLGNPPVFIFAEFPCFDDTMTDVELNQKLQDLKSELFNLRFRHASGQLENPLSIRTCKRDIAKVNTEIRARPTPSATSCASASGFLTSFTLIITALPPEIFARSFLITSISEPAKRTSHITVILDVRKAEGEI